MLSASTRYLSRWLLILVVGCLLGGQVFAQTQEDAFNWTNASSNGLDFTPTLYVVGDPKLPAAALRGLSRIIHPQGSSSGNDSLLLPAVKAGLLIALFFACAAWFAKGKIGLVGWAGVCFVAWLMFIQTSAVRVQTYFTYSGSTLSTGQLDSSGLVANGSASTPNGIFAVGGAGRFELVDGVPLGFALPVGISGAISTALADLFMTSYSTVNASDTGGLQFADPLKVLLELRAANPCVSAQLCKSIFEYTRYCLVGSVTNSSGAVVPAGVDLQAIARSPTAIDDIFTSSAFTASGWLAGLTRYYPPPSASSGGATLTDGIPMPCTDAGPKIRDDITNFTNGSTVRTQMGSATATPGKSESTVAATPTSLTENPAIGALQNLQQLAGVASLDASATVQNLVAWKAIAAGISTVSTPMDSASFTAMSMVQEATEKWRVDGAAEGSVFLRGLFASFNVMLFVLICFTPIVFILAVTMFGETFKILKEYIIAIVWTQSWFPAAVIVNFYITETLATKLFSYNNANPAAIFAPINHVAFYEELASSIGSAGWMIGSIPVLTYALLRGSVQGIVSLASKAGGGGGAKYADEGVAAPSLASSTNEKAMTAAAEALGYNAAYASNQNLPGGSAAAPGSGISVGRGQVTEATDSNAVSLQNRATASSAVATQAMTDLTGALAKTLSQGGSIGLTFGDGSSTTITSDTSEANRKGVSSELAGAMRSTVMTGASFGLNAAQVGAAVMAGSAAYGAAGGKAGGAAATKAAENAMGAKLGGKYGKFAGATAATLFGVGGAAISSMKGSGQWNAESSNNLSNAISDAQDWSTRQGISEQRGFQSGVTGAKTANETETDNLTAAYKKSESATQTAQRDATAASTASSTATNARNIGGNVNLAQGDVENAAKAAGVTKGSADQSVGLMANRLQNSGAISPEEASASVSEYGDKYARAIERLPSAQRGTPGGQIAAAVAATAAMASGGSTTAARLVGGAAFGDIATTAGTLKGNQALATAGAEITQGYLGSGAAGTGASASAGGTAARASIGTDGQPVQPPPITQTPEATVIASAVAAGQSGVANAVQGGVGKIDVAQAALDASGITQKAAADKGRSAITKRGDAAVDGSTLHAKTPTGPLGLGQPLNPPGSPGKSVGQGTPDQTPLPASNPGPFPSAEPSEAERIKSLNNGLSPANARTVRTITDKRSDIARPVAEAIARSRSSLPATQLVNRILQSPTNLAALSAANISGLGDVSKLPPQTQGELAVFMDRMGPSAIPLLQGKMTAEAARAELANLVGNDEAQAKLSARFNDNPQAALLAYATASAVSRAAGKAPPAIEGRTPTAIESEVVGFMNRTLDPMNAVGGFGLGVLINEITYFGGAAINKVTTGESGLGTAPTQSAPAPAISQPAWALGSAAPKTTTLKAGSVKQPAAARPAVKLPAAAEGVLTALTNNPEAAARSMSPDGLRRLLASESSGLTDATNAQGSSATGLGQFVTGTWLDQATRANSAISRVALEKGLVERTPTGLRIVDGKQAELLALRNDPALMTEATIAYAQQNLAALSAAKLDGIGDTSKLQPYQRDAYAYVMHMLGPGNGMRMLKGGSAALSEAESRVLLQQQIGVERAARYAELAGGAAPALQRFVTQRAAKVGGIAVSG